MRYGPRFTVRRLLLWITLLAVGCAAWVHEAAWTAGAVLLLNLFALAWGFCGALCATGTARRYWIGFTLFGATYFAAAFNTPLLGLWRLPANTTLLTTHGLDYLDSLRRPPWSEGMPVSAPWTNGRYYDARIKLVEENRLLVAWDDGSADLWVASTLVRRRKAGNTHQQTGHGLLTLFFAMLGGILVETFMGREPFARENHEEACTQRSAPKLVE